MAKKLTDFQTPTGATGNLLSPASWLQLIIGSAVLLITFAMGQNLASKIGGKVPFVDSQIEKPYVEPRPVSAQNKVEVL